jgi:hypothetical protein
MQDTVKAARVLWPAMLRQWSKSEERQRNAAQKVDRTLDCTESWIRVDVSSGSRTVLEHTGPSGQFLVRLTVRTGSLRLDSWDRKAKRGIEKITVNELLKLHKQSQRARVRF